MYAETTNFQGFSRIRSSHDDPSRPARVGNLLTGPDPSREVSTPPDPIPLDPRGFFHILVTRPAVRIVTHEKPWKNMTTTNEWTIYGIGHLMAVAVLMTIIGVAKGNDHAKTRTGHGRRRQHADSTWYLLRARPATGWYENL